MARSKKKASNFADYAKKLITFRQPKSPASEAYRTLRTNIDFSSFDKEMKTLVLTSATPEEGKSTITANLGVAMAMVGKRVIILDADLRNPTQHKFFDASNNIGLTSLLINENLKLEDALAKTGIENLSLLPSGPLPPNPAELLVSKKMRNFFVYLRQEYDMILVDSPPIIAVSDASVLASYLDGVILVVAAGQVTKDEVQIAKEQLMKVKANLLGAVLNKVPLNGRGYYYYYYYGKKR